LLEVSYILSPRTAGPDYTPEQLASETNLIVLCPTHNRVTTLSGEFSAEWLTETKRQHEQRVRDRLELAATPTPRRVSTAVRSPLVVALDAWNARHGDELEEHWQQLFMALPCPR
jgi:hypothetical protein